MDFNSFFKLNLTFPYHDAGMIITSKNYGHKFIVIKKAFGFYQRPL